MPTINEPVHPGASQTESTGRPVGVILIAAVCFFFAVAMAFVVLQTALGSGGDAADAVLSPQWLLVASALIPVCTISGIGLLMRRNWARYLVVAGMVAAIIGLVVRGLGMSSLEYGMRNAFTGSLLPVAIMLYLLHPSIRAAFQR